MSQMKMMVTALTVAMMLAATGVVRAGEVPVPDQAINDNVALAVWIDVEALEVDAIRQSVQSIADDLPEDMADAREPMVGATEEGLGDFQRMRDAFVGAGGKGVLFIMPGLPGGNAMGNGEPMVLLHTAPGTTPEGMRAAMTEAEPDDTPPALSSYADGWLRVAEEGQPVIEDGEGAHAATFRELFGASGDAPIRVVVRVTDEMKQQIAQQGQADPMMAGFAGALESLSTAWTTVNFGDQPQVSNRMNFDSPEAAAEFNAAWEGLLMMGEGMAMGQLAQMPDAPGPEAVQGLFQSLKMEQDGESLSLNLGGEFIGHASEFAPMAMGMAMMMMMGGQMDHGGWDEPAEQPQPMF